MPILWFSDFDFYGRLLAVKVKGVESVQYSFELFPTLGANLQKYVKMGFYIDISRFTQLTENLGMKTSRIINHEMIETSFQFASTLTPIGHNLNPKIPDITILPCNLESDLQENQESEDVNLEPKQVPTLLGESFSIVSSVEGRTRVSSLSSVTFSQNYSTEI